MISIEECAWDIHKLVDDAVSRIKDYLSGPKEPYSPLLKGFKGKSYINTGYVYTPYIPLIMTKKNKKLLKRYSQNHKSASFEKITP